MTASGDCMDEHERATAGAERDGGELANLNFACSSH
jgi:hypothetical protein